MSAPIKDGGPAFPWEDTGCIPGLPRPSPGMTLRDWFAGQALAGWLASFAEDAKHPTEVCTEDINARCAYAMADAMIAAREGGAE